MSGIVRSQVGGQRLFTNGMVYYNNGFNQPRLNNGGTAFTLHNVVRRRKGKLDKMKRRGKAPPKKGAGKRAGKKK